MTAQYNPQIHHRRSIRLQRYDYTQCGAYFVTLVTHTRECLFGDVCNANIELSEVGKIIVATWEELPDHFKNIELDQYVIMPNHLHGIIVIVHEPDAHRDGVGAKHLHTRTPIEKQLPVQMLRPNPGARSMPNGTQPRSLNAIVRNFKSVSTRKIHNLPALAGQRLWQGNYYEHIIRNDRELDATRAYIAQNITRWGKDAENPLRRA